MYRTQEEELLVPILVIDGEVGHENYESLLRDLERVMDGGSQAVLLDFSSTSFIDGACLGVLALRRLGPAGRLAVAGASDDVRRVFRVGGLTSMSRFELFESREEALTALLLDESGRISPALDTSGRRRRRAGAGRPPDWSSARVVASPRNYGTAIFGVPSLTDRIHD